MSSKSDNNIKEAILNLFQSKLEPFTINEISEHIYHQSFNSICDDKKIELESSLKHLISENQW